MTDQEKYKKCERNLYNYIRNNHKLLEVRERYKELLKSSDVHAQKYESNILSHGQYSDPTGDYAEKCIRSENYIKYLEGKTCPVEKLKDDLQKYGHINNNRILLKILIRIYFWHMGINDFCLHYRIARRTFYRRKNELVKKAMKYFGL